MIKLLEPIEIVTRRLCGAEYPTLNLVYPYMELLKKRFAPKENETISTYINLIYGEEYEENDDDEIDDDIPSAGVRYHWQHAHRQFHQKMKNIHIQKQRINRNQTQSSNIELEDLNPNKVEYLPPVSTNGLLQKVRAAVYLSMDELWTVLTNIALVATFLDPRFKHFNWTTEQNRNEVQNLVKILYIELKKNLSIPDDIEETLNMNKDHEKDEDDFFYELEGTSTQINIEKEDEVTYYVKLELIKIKDNPLEWWLKNKDKLPVLAQLARKYLSIPSTLVPSERLFSDAGNHISAKRTRLSPDLVNKILFLKRNSSHFDIFPSQEE